MKTRSNMPLFVLEVSDVKALSNSQIDLLRCGDWLVKKDASGEHPYQVTFKKEGVGMCLTYHDASVIETQSYDFTDGNWVYNSEDKTPNLLDAQTEDDVIALMEEGEPMEGYSVTTPSSIEDFEFYPVYAGAVKNGNKLTLVFSFKLQLTDADAPNKAPYVIDFNIPENIGSKLYTTTIATLPFLDNKVLNCFSTWLSSVNANCWLEKQSNTKLQLQIDASNFVANTVYYIRYEVTFLLSENLIEE